MNVRLLIIFSLGFAILQVFGAEAQQTRPANSSPLKPRIIVLTDVSTWEPDDSESLVRLLVHADLFEIEGLIYTTGWSLEETREDFFQLIHDAIDAYEKDLPNLLKRSGQTGFREDENRQYIGYWPSPEYLREHTMFGSKKRGMDQIGRDNISDGSNWIIEQADEDDERPLWILIWGGGNTLAQAIWQVQQDRSGEELKVFLQKIPAYAITDQDRSYKGGTPYDISSHQWMRREFKENLLFIWDECAWKFQNGTGRENWEEYATHIQNHGNLGEIYPKYKYGVEGDTPSFFHVMPNGLNNPLIPGQVGWGGYFEFMKGPDNSTYAYTNHSGQVYKTCEKYASYFYPATFNNFVARMDWASEGKGNRNPVIIINGTEGIDPIQIEKKAGKTIKFNASGSFDPDADQLSFKWWILPEAGTCKQDIKISSSDSEKVSVKLPSDSSGKSIHVICEVTDNGEPALTSYRRIIIKSR
jgi:hypothetical protein